MKTLISGFWFPGHPVPAVRMTRGSMWTQAAQNYIGYKMAFAEALATEFPEWVLKDIPPVEDKKARARFTKAQQEIFYRLEMGIYTFPYAKRGDADNYCKSVMDALQASGIVWNDKQIVDSRPIVRPGDKGAGVFLRLQQFESILEI